MKLRVLFVAEENDLPESEMICALSNSGVQATVVLNPSSRWVSKYQKAGVKEVIKINFTSKIDFKAIHALRQICIDAQIDIVQVFSKKALSNVLLAIRSLPVKVIAYRGIVGNLSVFDPMSWMTFLHPRIDSLVCVCTAIQDYLRRFPGMQSKVVTIHKGHKIEWYNPYAVEKLTELGVDTSAPIICCAANYRKRKGIESLVAAFDIVTKRTEANLLLFGRGMENIKSTVTWRSINCQQRIYFGGYRPDVTSYVGACDIFVMPSLRREGLPKAVIEAMAQGVCPVVTNVGGMLDLVDDGVNGRILQAGSPQKLADALLEILLNKDLKNTLSYQAKLRIKNDFSLGKTVDAYLSLYKTLIPEFDKCQEVNGY